MAVIQHVSKFRERKEQRLKPGGLEDPEGLQEVVLLGVPSRIPRKRHFPGRGDREAEALRLEYKCEDWRF